MPSIYDTNRNPIILDLLRNYQATAGAGALFELQARMLAEVSPSIGPEVAHAHVFTDPFEAILDVYAAELGVEGVEALRVAKKLRDKVVHSDFAEAHKKHRKSAGSASVPTARAIQVDIAGLKLDEVVEKVVNADGQAVVNTKNTKDGTFFGWLFEFGPQFPMIEEMLLEAAGAFYELAGNTK